MNRESERKRLVELIDDFFKKESGIGFTEEFLGELATNLIANGIVVPPVKVGDVVYGVFEGDVLEDEIILIEITQTATYLSTCTERYMWINGHLYSEMLDQILYFTREEAEKMLKGEGK